MRKKLQKRKIYKGQYYASEFGSAKLRTLIMSRNRSQNKSSYCVGGKTHQCVIQIKRWLCIMKYIAKNQIQRKKTEQAQEQDGTEHKQNTKFNQSLI